jgi:proteasome lid subunit RPN8/RPN11
VEEAMIEAGAVVTGSGVVHWHLPAGRTGGSLPDSRQLWDVLWDLRKEELLGFAHSHPGSGVPGPSQIDITTFAAVELGLGRRLDWWITSSDRVILLGWHGPGKHYYMAETLAEEPDWAAQLRHYSEKEKDDGSQRSTR